MCDFKEICGCGHHHGRPGPAAAYLSGGGAPVEGRVALVVFAD
ncbi:hypothetical protein [Methanothermobacter thermautotrophicus]|nr:hypothetical protein [Methanothermobacter thermautotrophicus]